MKKKLIIKFCYHFILCERIYQGAFSKKIPFLIKYEDLEYPLNVDKLRALPVTVVGKTLIDLGVDKHSLQSIHNDFGSTTHWNISRKKSSCHCCS